MVRRSVVNACFGLLLLHLKHSKCKSRWLSVVRRLVLGDLGSLYLAASCVMASQHEYTMSFPYRNWNWNSLELISDSRRLKAMIFFTLQFMKVVINEWRLRQITYYSGFILNLLGDCLVCNCVQQKKKSRKSFQALTISPIATASRLCLRPSVSLSVRDVGVSLSHRLEMELRNCSKIISRLVIMRCSLSVDLQYHGGPTPKGKW